MELRINPADRDFLFRELAAAQAEGKVWTVFNDLPELELDRFGLHYFGTQREAEEFCAELNVADNNPYDDIDGWDYFQYVPVSEMQRYMMGVPETYRPLDLSETEVAGILELQQLSLSPGRHYADLLRAFEDDLMSVVIWKTRIEPSKTVADFHVVQHQHAGHQVYETGHSIRTVGRFDGYPEATARLVQLLKQSVLEKDGSDYLLIGRYHGQQLELNMNGHPAKYTGMLLETAYWQYDTELGKNTYNRQQLHSVDEPVEIDKYFFARFDRGTQSIAVLDGLLQKVSPEYAQPLLAPWYYKDNLLITKNLTIMNQQSFEYNKDQLINLGFGSDLAKDLHTKMDQNLAEFTLTHRREFGKDAMESVLHFSKGDSMEKDLTFFNRFDTTLKKEGMEDLTQTFFVGQKYNYTLQERYNMMDGRSAFREQPKMVPEEQPDGKTKMVPTGETYFAWRALDFKEADRFGNFNPKVLFWKHEQELMKYPIKGVENKYERSRMMRPLEKGNQVNIVLLRDGVETPVKVVANPRMMRLDFYDSEGKNLVVRKSEKQAVDQSQKVEMTPQEVQKAAIARAAEQAEQNKPLQNQQAGQTESDNQKTKVTEKQEQGAHRRQGIRI